MLDQIISHLKHDHQKDWLEDMGSDDYFYADTASEQIVNELWSDQHLGDKAPCPKHLLQRIRAAFIVGEEDTKRRYEHIMLH
jgi:hypothetical protein